MAVQYINDSKGKPTGVFIPITDWKNMTKKYSELQLAEKESSFELLDWHKEIIDQRLADVKENPNANVDFDKMISSIEKEYDL